MPSTPPRSRVARAQLGDVPHLAAMRRHEGWSANQWLLQHLVRWSHARVLVLRDVETRTQSADHATDVGGTIVATAYGSVGFIGNVIVNPAARGRGYGKLLMAAAIDWLIAEGTQTVVLDATTTGRPLYERFGFVGIEHSWAIWQSLADLRLDEAVPSRALTFQLLGSADIGEISTLDGEAFGGNRMALLAALPDLVGARCYVVRGRSSEVDGYLLARPLEEPEFGMCVGPFVARSPEAARVLFVEAVRRERAMIATTAMAQAHLALGVPGANAGALELYRTLGVSMVADDLRMRLDLATHEPARVPALEQFPGACGRPDWIYGMLSTMVG